MRDGGGVCVVSAGDDINLETRPPKLELLNRGRAKSVTGREQDDAPLPLQKVRELGGGGGLARAVDADNGDNGEAADLLIQCRVRRREASLDFLCGDGEDIQPAAALRFVGQLHGGENLLGHRHAEVGGEQRVLKLFEGLTGQLGGAGDDAFEFVAEFGSGLVQTCFDFREQSHAERGA